MCQCMLFMVRRGVVYIIIVVALICMDIHHCVISLKDTCLIVQKGGLVACPELRKGAHGFRGGTRFQIEPNVKSVPHA